MERIKLNYSQIRMLEERIGTSDEVTIEHTNMENTVLVRHDGEEFLLNDKGQTFHFDFKR